MNEGKGERGRQRKNKKSIKKERKRKEQRVMYESVCEDKGHIKRRNG